jgi:outer membrane receptor protein involved in Fe transport
MTTIRQAVASVLAKAARSDDSLAWRSEHIKWGTCAAALALIGFSAATSAQQAPATGPNPSAAGGAVTLEEVTVTGSRIKRTTDFNTPTPTTVIDSSTLDSLGVVNVGEVLEMSPANISTFTPAATGNANFFTGSYLADLRGINPFFGSRTLTLINSRRVVQSNQGDSFDLNFIPQVLVDRIDTVTGGASAAYGSGAISGVLNIFLNTKLEGGKINADAYQSYQSDSRDRHIGAAYGHGLFDNRLHFVIGGEWEKSDALACQDARSWCGKDGGIYQITPNPGGRYSYGTGLHFGTLSQTGVVNPAPTTTGGVIPQFNSDGTALMPYQLGALPFAGAGLGNSAINPIPGGSSGEPIYKYVNLLAPVNRGVITGTITSALTDTINMSLEGNWGKVETTNFNQGLSSNAEAISSQNAFIPASLAGSPVLFPGGARYFTQNKDYTSQIESFTRFTTTVKRFALGFDGKFGSSSWTWDGYYTYGLTNREQLVHDQRTVLSYSMAVDSIIGPNGQPECRVTSVGGSAPASAFNFFGNTGTFPGYFLAAVLGGPAGAAQASALAQGCVPLNPFGNAPMSQAAHDYAFGNLDERLRYEQTVAAFNTSGNYFDGVGAGPFAAAAGIEWRQEVGHNDQAGCPAGTEGNPTLCHYKIDDFLIQYGEPFGGTVTVLEGFLETNLPLLKDRPGAHLLEIDLAGRESHYDNRALYGINVTPGTTPPEFKHNLTTWKASAIWEPVDGFRIRGSQSRDARAANFRELYYGQIFTPGGIFGYCDAGRLGFGTDPCRWNLEGNTSLAPETSDTTTFGFVVTPKEWIPGFQFSADWVHIKIKNAIQQANIGLVWDGCRLRNEAAACNAMVFNNIAYVPNPLYPQPGQQQAIPAGPGQVGVTGAAAWQIGAPNALVTTANSFNGAFYETKAIDFSLNYLLDLGKGGSLNTRILTTWTDEQKFQNNKLAPVFNILGQTGTGNLFLNDNQPTAKWRGNVIITWAQGPLSITPNMRYVGHGIQDYTYPANLFYAGSSLKNYVPSYFVFGLNGTYSFENIAAVKGLQIYAQVDNVLNKTPPTTFGGGAFGVSNGTGGTNPVFFDTIGLAYRMGFRMTF